jgi:hypothetical protein
MLQLHIYATRYGRNCYRGTVSPLFYADAPNGAASCITPRTTERQAVLDAGALYREIIAQYR